MSRINTNVQSLIAQRVLGQNNQLLNTSLERLSTGLKINRGKDDPAGLIASENLRSEKTALKAAIGNAERADQVVNIAEGGLQEVSALLTELQGILTTTANTGGLSQEEREANQLQIDSILQTIDRIAGSTNFQGVRLLNGNFDYTTSGVNAGVTDFAVNGVKLGAGESLEVKAVITTSAQQAGLYLSTGGTLDLGGGINSAFTIEVSGTLGSRELSFASGTTQDDMVAAINTFTEVTGVSAALLSTGIKLASKEFGSSAFVSVTVVNAANMQGTDVGIYKLMGDDFNAIDAASLTDYANANNGVRDAGQDLAATINGIAATTKGKTARINTDFLDVQLTFTNDVAQRQGGNSAITAFSINGGGADFQLASSVDIGGKVSLGIKDVAVRKLGSSEAGFLDTLQSGRRNNLVDGDLGGAQSVVKEAIQQISSLRGRLGAFQKNVIGATVRNLNVSLENTTAAESVIRDADFASETAQLTRSQILVQAATNTLALANQQPQSALSLIG